MDSTLNFMIIFFLLLMTISSMYFIFFKRKKSLPVEKKSDYYQFENIASLTAEQINRLLNMNVEELRLNESETRKRIRQKSILRDAVRNCCLGDGGKKEYVKDYIKTILQDSMGVDEETILKVVPFHRREGLGNEIKFLILYSILSEKHGSRTFGYLCDEVWNVEKKKEDGLHYEVTDEDIGQSFDDFYRELDFSEKLEILTQLIYQKLYGLDVVDIIIADDSIDNVSGGVGGITEFDYNYMEELIDGGQVRMNCYDTIFVMYHGRQIRMSCLSFGTKDSLKRVVKNIYRYDTPKMLTAQNGFTVASRQDNTRVTVSRPPVSASWAFFLRKFKSTSYKLNSLIRGNNAVTAIAFLQILVRSMQTFVVSGSPASGKTTLLKALVPYIDPRLSIRMAENVFETMFNVLLPDRNIHVMQERGDARMVDIINVFKRMDTDVTILGEITELDMAGAFIQISQAGGKMTMCTLHHETTGKLIDYMRNAVMVYYDLKDPVIATEQVINAVHFDIHCERDDQGVRYISRVTEIIPAGRPEYKDLKQGTLEEQTKSFYKFYADNAGWKPYRTRDILVYDKVINGYYIKNMVSRTGLSRMQSKVSRKDFVKMYRFMESKVAEYKKIQEGIS